MRRIRWAAAIMAAGMIALAGCSVADGDEPGRDEDDQFTVVPTVAPSEAAGINEPLAQGSSAGVQVTIYAEGAYSAEHGCGCAVEAGGPELYPAGTRVVQFRFVLKIIESKLTDRDTYTIPNLETEMENVGEFEQQRLAVLDEEGGSERAEESGFSWLPDGAFGDEPVEMSIGDSRTWTTAYYVPKDIQMVRIFLTGYHSPDEVDTDFFDPTGEFDVRLPEGLSLK